MYFFALALSFTALGLPTDAPPYPHEVPKRFQAIKARLDTKISFAVPKATEIRTVLRSLEELSGLKLDLRDDAAKRIGRIMTLSRVQNLETRQILRITLAQVKLHVCPTADALVVTNLPDRYPLPESVQIQNRLRQVRESIRRPSAKPKKDSLEQLEDQLRAVKIQSLKFVESPLSEILQTLRLLSGINVLLSPKVDPDQAISQSFENVDALQALRSTLKAADGLGYLSDDGVLVIAKSARVRRDEKRRKARRQAAAARKSAISKLLAVKLGPLEPTKPLRELVRPLERGLGVRVYFDRAAWRRRDAIGNLPKDATLDTLRKTLLPRSVEIVVEPDAVLFLNRARPTKGPAAESPAAKSPSAESPRRADN